MPTSGSSGCAIREVAAAVDFITIHILPYWEDFPIPARNAAAHVEAIRPQVVAAFPGKEILIGEVGWPSAGRMREGALPSPANQARVDPGRAGARQARKFPRQRDRSFRRSRGSARSKAPSAAIGACSTTQARNFKFDWGEPVSNHPLWVWQAAGGVAFAVARVRRGWFAAARRSGRRLRGWP